VRTYPCRDCGNPIIFRTVGPRREDGSEVPSTEVPAIPSRRRRVAIHVEGGGCPASGGLYSSRNARL